MTHSTLFTLGTPFGRWSSVATAFLDTRLLDPAVAKWHQEVVRAPLPEVNGANVLDLLLKAKVAPEMAKQLQSLRPAGATPWGGADVRLCWTGNAVAQSLPEARFLVWVEHPARLLAQWMLTAGVADPVAALAIIESSIQGVVNLVHRQRARCLVVYADEAIAHPDALARQLKETLGVAPGRLDLPATPALNPLHLVLSQQLVAASPRLLREYERLYASCIPLTEASELPAEPLAPLTLDAFRVYQQMERAACEGTALAPQLKAAEAQRQLASDELDKARREGELLVVQLHQVQEELEQTFLKQQQDQQKAKAELEQLRAADAEREKAVQALKTAQAAVAAEREAMTKAQEQLRADVKRQAQENELMLVQLHQVQEELEHYYLAYRDLEATQGARTALPVSTIKVARVEVGTERDTPPHRELNLVLHDVQAVDRKFNRLQVRLVEHHGRPGLALFQSGTTPVPLAAWEPSGTEGERSYVLLVPTDEQGKQRLQRMGSADWRFTEGVVHSIERALDASSASARWKVTARRLAQQLADAPARFRFDRIDAAEEAQSAGAFILTYGNVLFGSQQLGDVQLRWRPQADQVELLRPETGEVLLPGSWPVDEAGAWRPSWPLPLAGVPQATPAHTWNSFSRAEREFLLGLLDALPAAAAAAASLRDKGAGVDAGDLAQAAVRPLQVAHRLVHGTRLRRMVRAARGRLSP